MRTSKRLSELRTWDRSYLMQVVFYKSCRFECLNYLKKISQTWWSSVGSILKSAVVVCV